MQLSVQPSVTIDWTSEAAEWRANVDRLLGADAALIHVSRYSSDVRAYQLGNRVMKVRRLTAASISNRPNTLEDEYQVLRHLLKEERLPLIIPRPIRYICLSGWEALEMEAIDPPAIKDPVVAPHRESIASMLALAGAVWALNRVGVSHGDLTIFNVGRNRTGEMVILDFDQGVRAHPIRCVLRDFLGFPCRARAAQFSVLDRGWSLRFMKALARGIMRVRRWKPAKHKPESNGVMDELCERARARGMLPLQQLADCWWAAASAGANSPGSNVAYYSLDLGGLHFPGERPWFFRWETISRAVSFQGKRVVELGCNLGLLAIHARLSGAASVIGVDHNGAIIAAAEKLAVISGADVSFRQVDFDRDQMWEDGLGNADLVTALSLTHWLQDKERMWNYLARVPEVIFEGHEEQDEIESRLAQRGFSWRNLGVSERSRPIYYAVKNRPLTNA